MTATRQRLGLILSLLLYAAAVSAPLRSAGALADRSGCVEAHAVVIQLLMLAGVVGGLAVGAPAISGVQRALQAMMPGADAAQRAGYLRGLAWALILLSAATNALWVAPALNMALDAQRALLVEADVLLYAMGVLAGIGWHALLDRDGWLGLLLMPAMALMILSSGVIGRGWC
ncbi:MAG TPA: hypothetical protein VNM16_05925 [Bacillota bacterium]|nr:hypothetical protein [Bacillota bacterium]